MAAYTKSLLPAICFSFASKSKTKLDVDWYRQEFDIPQTASTQQTLHLLASEQLIIAQDAGNYAITNLGALLFARDLNDFPTVARKALRVIPLRWSITNLPISQQNFFLRVCQVGSSVGICRSTVA